LASPASDTRGVSWRSVRPLWVSPRLWSASFFPSPIPQSPVLFTAGSDCPWTIPHTDRSLRGLLKTLRSSTDQQAAEEGSQPTGETLLSQETELSPNSKTRSDSPSYFVFLRACAGTIPVIHTGLYRRLTASVHGHRNVNKTIQGRPQCHSRYCRCTRIYPLGSVKVQRWLVPRSAPIMHCQAKHAMRGHALPKLLTCRADSV